MKLGKALVVGMLAVSSAAMANKDAKDGKGGDAKSRADAAKEAGAAAGKGKFEAAAKAITSAARILPQLDAAADSRVRENLAQQPALLRALEATAGMKDQALARSVALGVSNLPKLNGEVRTSVAGGEVEKFMTTLTSADEKAKMVYFALVAGAGTKADTWAEGTKEQPGTRMVFLALLDAMNAEVGSKDPSQVKWADALERAEKNVEGKFGIKFNGKRDEIIKNCLFS